MPPASFSAVVLAAGRSSRMGRDKALLEVDGVPLWRRQRDLFVSLSAAEIFLSARPGQAWARGAAGFSGLLYDALANAGPLCGVTAALERASHTHVAVLAVDLPRMRAEWFRQLLDGCASGVGMVGRHAEHFEPLAAVYPRELIPLAWAALANGRNALQPLLHEAAGQGLLRVREIGAEEAVWFENWNEPVFAPQEPES